MLPNDAFLRRLPKTLNPRERLALEALVFSADSIDASYQSIISLTSALGEKIPEIQRIQRSLLFTFAWSIIDHLHVCRQLLSSLGVKTKTAAKFVKETERATDLRNKMDHLKGNIDNLTKSKRPRPPLFGAITYIYISEATDGNALMGGTVLISAGTWSHSLKMEMLNPAGRPLRLPVSGFQLEAFDKKVSIERAAHALRDLITDLNHTVEEVSRERLHNIAQEKGIPVERLSENFGEGLAVFLAFKTRTQ
jgi:hypothetical protein